MPNSYTLHITLYDLFFFGMIFIGVNFVLLLWFVKGINQAANRFLALALLTMILLMIRVLAIDALLQTYLPHWDRAPMQFLLALGPLIYFYVLKITRPEYKFGWRNLLHFSPLLLEQAVFVLEIRESIKTGAATYVTPAFYQLNPVLELLIFISIVTYLNRCHKLIQNFYRRLQPVLMDRSRLEFRWLRRLLAATALLWAIWIGYAAVDYFGYRSQLGIHGYYPFYIFFAVIIIWTATAAFLKPQAGQLVPSSPVSKSSAPIELREKGIWLRKAIESDLHYRDPELSLSALAEELGIHPHELSRIVNVALKKNFNDFINEYRIRDVVQKMQDPAYDRMTLLGVSFESGFNSKSTFNRTFRQMTGKSPAEYKNELKKGGPSYHLTPFFLAAAVISTHEATPKWGHEKLNRNYMFRNYLKIAWRNMLHNKVYSALNIVGLATGMAVALLIGLWVIQQYAYDRFLPNYTNLYQVRFNFTDPHDGEHTQPAVCLPLANVLRTTVPGIKRVAETGWVGFNVRNLRVGDKRLLPTSGDVNPEFLKIFQYPFVKGDRNTALNDVYSIVIDESTAKALFGNADPMYKTVRVDNQHDVKVTGVFKDIPATASLKFNCLLPFTYKRLTEDWMKNAYSQWSNNSFEMFVELQPDVTYEQIAPKIKDLLIKYQPAYKNAKGEVILQPIKDQHLYNDYKNGKAVGGFIDYVHMFSVIGGLVLLIACINFMNLSTARSEKRAREVGVRKAIGSQRRDLIWQFLTESLMVTFAAFLFSVLLVQLALNPFNALTGSTIQIPYGNPAFWGIMSGYVALTGLLAGSRPAFYLSSFNPVKVLKGTIQVGKAASVPRKILVVVQFSCSVALIISTVIIYQQIQYVKDRPVGYSRDRLVTTFMSDDLMHGYDALKNDLLATRMIQSVTKASSPLTDVYWHTSIDKWPGQNAGEQGINVAGVTVTDNYFRTVGMKLVEGRDFTPDWASDTTSVIVNETAVKRMGLKQPINQIIDYAGGKNQRIIGVVKDALMESPFTPVEPMIFNHGRGPNVMIYRLASGVNPHMAMQKIGKIFDKYNPAYPFDYLFVDNAYDQKFNFEELIGKLAGIFAALAVFISCLGLFGLAAYVAEQRTKEIGIRKVLGASIANVWMLLSKDFIVLVMISCLIASPVAIYFLKPWLEKYDYRIGIGPGVFFLSSAAAIIITILTVSFQAIKAAVTNPVRSLRSE